MATDILYIHTMVICLCPPHVTGSNYGSDSVPRIGGNIQGNYTGSYVIQGILQHCCTDCSPTIIGLGHIYRSTNRQITIAVVQISILWTLFAIKKGWSVKDVSWTYHNMHDVRWMQGRT